MGVTALTSTEHKVATVQTDMVLAEEEDQDQEDQRLPPNTALVDTAA